MKEPEWVLVKSPGWKIVSVAPQQSLGPCQSLWAFLEMAEPRTGYPPFVKVLLSWRKIHWTSMNLMLETGEKHLKAAWQDAQKE